MNLDIELDKLSKYDLTKAKVGDKVIICRFSNYNYDWSFEEAVIKSISPKRGDITFNDPNRTRVDKYGKKIGAGTWGHKYYFYLESTQENTAIINRCTEGINKVRGIIKLFGNIEKQGFKMLYDLPKDKIDILHKTMTEVFKVNENE